MVSNKKTLFFQRASDVVGVAGLEPAHPEDTRF